MTTPAPDTRTKQELLDQVAQVGAEVEGNLGGAERIQAFLTHYFRHVDPEDVCRRDVRELTGLVGSHFKLAAERKPGETKLRVFTPTADDGFTASGHTVIEVVTDDRPFIVDSVTMALTRDGWRIHDLFHPQFRVMRDADGHLTDIVSRKSAEVDEATPESWLLFEASAPLGQSDRDLQPKLASEILEVLADIADVVEDWKPMLEQGRKAAAYLHGIDDPRAPRDAAMMQWLTEDNFAFLGYREYAVDGERYTPVEGTGLGLLRGERKTSNFDAVPTSTPPDLMTWTKDSVKSRLHRPVYTDYVGVREFDAAGNIVREHRFLGLLASQAYRQSAFDIPGLAMKAQAIEEAAGYDRNSQGGKALRTAIDQYPRDELFQASVEQLAPVLEQVGRLKERRQVRLFLRRGDHGRFLTALVYLPRDHYNTSVREALQKVLMEGLGAESLEYSTSVTESVLARLYFTVKLPEGKELPADINTKDLEEKLTMAIRDWDDEFEDLATGLSSDERGIEFPDGYRENFSPRQGLLDLQAFNQIKEGSGRQFALYSPEEAGDRADLRLKMFSLNRDANLSAILPHLDKLGVTVLDERPYGVTVRGHKGMVYDFGLHIPGGKEALGSDYTPADRERIIQAFDDSYTGGVEADALNQLVLSAKLTVDEVAVLRAISRYLQQAGVAYSQDYIAQALVQNAKLAGDLVTLFAAKFDPRRKSASMESRKEAVASLRDDFLKDLDAVASLDHDKILRLFLQVIDGMIRTNAFAKDRPALAFKMLPQTMDLLPEPRPQFEIWVYSPRVEGVHIRFGKVARGGLRWSDRREDFRTEVLGLSNAQMFKNTVIVPVGAKGGFYPKHLPSPAVDRQGWLDEGKACYKIFINSLLSVTDNVVDGAVVPPADVVRWDEDDFYLVVAADKGTATFSDIANGIAIERNFWLGDAFASGGSVGYDHKGMGITARGAWESVKSHFHETGVDCQNEDFTCVGIGDMAGDVFGNGMLLSKHTRLVAAFNHLHIFLDPTPDAASTWTERKRMFDNRLGWDQFDTKLISAGGGVFKRTDKSITITPEVKAALGLPEGTTTMTPNELIHNILMAPVDLLYNGGIGTYVKSSDQSNAEVGDRANDAVRVNGNQIRAKIVGEGGNLGCTQLGRIEYALAGGRINTDFIDNSAGVDTSDHEVNIKILLAQEIAAGRMTMDERDKLLPQMTDEVAAHVLSHNIEQNKTLHNADAQSAKFAGIHEAWMQQLEAEGVLDRKVQFMPGNDEMEHRIASGKGLTNPELCTLLAATKIKLFNDVLASDLPDDPYLADRLIQYFPQLLRDKFRDEMPKHRLHREIITTVAINRFVDSQGITAYYRLSEETGASVADVMRAQLASRAIFNAGLHETQINRAQGLTAQVETELRLELRLLVERGTRWLLSNRRRPLDITAAVEQYTPGVASVKEMLPELLSEEGKAAFEAKKTELLKAGVDERLAQVIALAPMLHVALSIVSVSQNTGRELTTVAQTYLGLGQELYLDTLLDHVEALPQGNRWDTMSRAALRDDLLSVSAQLASEALKAVPGTEDGDQVVKQWVAQAPEADRKKAVLAEICAGESNLARMSVGMQMVRSLLDNKA